MPTTLITAEIENFIKKNYLKMSRGQIAKKFGFSKSVCALFYNKHNLKVPKSVIDGFRTKSLTDRTTFTQEEDEFIKKNSGEDHRSIIK